MSTKRNPGPYDGYGRAGFDEPIFTLRASDSTAPMLIREWGYLWRKQIAAGRRPPEDEDQIAEAIRVAEAMEAWRDQHRGRGR